MDENQKTYEILAGWVIDGTGGPVRRHVLMQIEGETIVSMRKAKPGELSLAQGRLVMDFSQCTIIPGLVDCHVHMTMSGINDQALRHRQLHLTFEEAEPLINDRIAKHLSYGIVAVRDGGDSAGHTLRYRIERLTTGDCLLSLKAAGKAWRTQGRYGKLIGQAPPAGWTLTQCIARQESKSDHVKIVNSGLNSLTQFGKETSPQFSPQDLEAGIRAARSRNQKVMVHANGKLPVRLAVEAGCSSIEHGFFMGRENMEKMAELQVFWVPTAFTMKAYSEQLDPGAMESGMALRNLEHQLEQMDAARQLGVPTVVGTDAGGLGIRHGKAFAEEFKLLLAAGYSIEQAVSCATFEGARLLGLEHELGRLKRSMPATFVVIPGDPSQLYDTLGLPQRVYIRGKPYG